MLRPEVEQLVSWAPLGPEADWDEPAVERFAAAVQAVTAPVNEDEATALLSLLERPYDDSNSGVLWGVLHLIESSESAVRTASTTQGASPWLGPLHQRWLNSQGRSGSEPGSTQRP